MLTMKQKTQITNIRNGLDETDPAGNQRMR